MDISVDDEFEIYRQRAYTYDSSYTVAERSLSFERSEINTGVDDQAETRIKRLNLTEWRKMSLRSQKPDSCTEVTCKYISTSDNNHICKASDNLSPEYFNAEAARTPSKTHTYQPVLNSSDSSEIHGADLSSKSDTIPLRKLQFSSKSAKETCSSEPVVEDVALKGGFRQRTQSMPSRKVLHRARLLLEGQLYRARSFSISGKAVVSQGDTFRMCHSSSPNSLRSSRSGMEELTSEAASDDLHASGALSKQDCNQWPSVYNVLLLGASEVGKTALSQQFVTSDYMAFVDTSSDEESDRIIPVLLDGEEFMLHITDLCSMDGIVDDGADAYVIVFSVTDLASFKHALQVLSHIREITHNQSAIILVANKEDLVRCRVITTEVGKKAAQDYGCKYIEVSALLNHHVDELLVGILRQIFLHSTRQQWCQSSVFAKSCLPYNACNMPCITKDLLQRLSSGLSWIKKPCDDLMVL